MSALQDLLDAPDRAVEACSHRARRLLERRMFGADRVECREELAVGGLAVGGTGFGMATGRRGAFDTLHGALDARAGGVDPSRSAPPRAACTILLHFPVDRVRSEEHTSDLKSQLRNPYASFSLKKKAANTDKNHKNTYS